MKSLHHETLTPKIQAFLDAVDSCMNSHTFLLKVQIDDDIEMTTLYYPYIGEFFYKLIESDFFTEVMLEVDKQRNWLIFHEFDGEKLGYVPGSNGKMGIHPEWLKPYPLSYLGFIEKLHWMLRTSLGFYQDTHPEESKAQQLIIDFCEGLFGSYAPNCTLPPQQWIGMPNWINQPWTFYSLDPSFMRQGIYFKGEGEKIFHPFSYFDGGPNDSATFFYKNDVFYLLLTNGSP